MSGEMLSTGRPTQIYEKIHLKRLANRERFLTIFKVITIAATEQIVYHFMLVACSNNIFILCSGSAIGRQDRQIIADHLIARKVSLLSGHSVYAMDGHSRFSKLASKILQTSKSASLS